MATAEQLNLKKGDEVRLFYMANIERDKYGERVRFDAEVPLAVVLDASGDGTEIEYLERSDILGKKVGEREVIPKNYDGFSRR